MSEVAISVEQLGKRYLLSHKGKSGDGLRHVLQETFSRPFRRRKGERSGAESSHGSTTEEFWALNDVSFEIKPGEVVGIIGRNGAGKSTLLKILSRITEPTTGQIIIDGRVASLLEVGTGFHPELTGRENIFLNGAILGMTRAEIKNKFDEIVDFAEIEKFLDTPVKRYSSGMYVRLAFAVAAHLEPEILIIDEVLAVGDAQFQAKCLGKMSSVATQGRTVLFVSHNMAAVERLCSSAILLQKGRLVKSGPASQVISSYLAGVQQSDYDVRLPASSQPVRIERIRLLPETRLAYGYPVEIGITVVSQGPLQSFSCGLSFDTVDGTRAMTIDSDNDGTVLQLPAGRSEVVLTLPYNPLHPTRYLCNAGISGSGQGLDFKPGFGVWEVATSDRDFTSLPGRGFGGCRPIVESRVDTNLDETNGRLSDG